MKTKFNLNNFINDLKKSKFLNTILAESPFEVICMYIVGSRATNIIDARSDIDILVLVDNSTDETKIEKKSEKFMTYSDVYCHWLYIGINSLLLDLPEKRILRDAGGVQFKFMSEDKIIYSNEKYKTLISDIINLKTEISFFSAMLLYNHLAYLVNPCTSLDDIPEQQYCKFYYHLAYTSDILLNVEFDLDLLNHIKRIRWEPTTKNERQEIIKKIINARIFLDTKVEEFNKIEVKLKQLYLNYFKEVN